MASFRTRQAPSPTGYLHFGTARTVLFTKLFAQINKGVWYLRLEDTDRNRLQVGAVGSLLDSLTKLGLQPDEGVTNAPVGEKDAFYGVYQSGNMGPYIQSERLSLYHEHAQKMIEKNLAYWCYLTKEEIDELQSIKQATRAPINYARICQEKYSPIDLLASVEVALQDERKPTLRYRLQRDKTIIVRDNLLGQSEFDLSLEEDFVILKSDGYPTYHLAHVIDDHLMQTSLVIRAQEWYPSLPKHTVMFEDYWGSAPEYLHLPFILSETGTKKMSKRDGNVNIEHYLNAGFMPEAIINYLAFLGWNPGTEQELYLQEEDFVTLDQPARLTKLINNIAAEFSLEKLSVSPARFSLEKLTWYNREYLKMLTVAEFVESALNLKVKNNVVAPKKLYFLSQNHTELFAQVIKNAELTTYRIPELAANTLTATELEIATNNQVVFEQNHELQYAEMRLYVVSKELLQPYFVTIENSGEYAVYEWVSLSDFFRLDPESFVRYNTAAAALSVPFAPPSVYMAESYAAWMLDKERAATLLDFGSDSASVINWIRPADREITWKKSTTAESKEHLSAILNEVIVPFFAAPEATSILSLQTEMLNAIVTKNITTSAIKGKFVQISTVWEQVLKDWIRLTGRDTGACLHPLRVAISGMRQSPSPFELLAILDKNEVTRRIQSVLRYEEN